MPVCLEGIVTSALCSLAQPSAVCPLLSTRSAVLDVRLHIAKLGVQPRTGSTSAAAHGSNERARRIERQRRNVAAEVSPNPILVEILLDVRQIEGRHRPAFGP